MLQLLVALILFTEASLNQPSVLVRGRLANRSCPDEDLAILCDGHCYTAYLACKDNCDSSSCERMCLTSYTTCYSSCPCFEYCPNGCDGCPNPICSCNEPQKNNSYYIHCMDQATDDFKACAMGSTNDKASYDMCYENFTMASEKCPCNSGCETGCPCESGFKCQENIMAMCQMTASSGRVNFTYVISADGFFQENRHYLSPQSSSSYNPFLMTVGSALLNGEIYFFGGDHDTQKQHGGTRRMGRRKGGFNSQSHRQRRQLLPADSVPHSIRHVPRLLFRKFLLQLVKTFFSSSAFITL